MSTAVDRFNAFIVYGFLPISVLVPIVKDKTKNISHKNNHRPIASDSFVSNVF